MLTISVVSIPGSSRPVLAGRITSETIEELRRESRRAWSLAGGLVLDLRDIPFVDATGVDGLLELAARGAVVEGTSASIGALLGSGRR